LLLIYSHHISARLEYIAKTLLGENIAFTDSKEKFEDHNGTKINYSNKTIDYTEFRIAPHGLLFETTIQEQRINCFEWNDLKVFFKTNGDIPFDIFAAAFYLLSRYEEYLPHQKDEYGRYAHSNSLAYRENFLQLPLVNLWVKELEKISGYRFKRTGFKFTPTYDIDIAFAYQHQPLWLNLFGFYRDLFIGNFEKFIERGNVYSGWKKDPFNIYDWLHELHEQYHVHPIYFFLVAKKRIGVDKNVSPQKKAMRRLIQTIAAKYEVGIHPSWRSGELINADGKLLTAEISSLQKIITDSVNKSRQHYLRFTIPETFRKLADAGIMNEYSMGYGGINGFRASYALPFAWFDLEKNETSHLKLHPFCFMDANSIFEQKYSVEETAEELQYYFDTVKKVNGELITLFHNHFLTEQPEWLPWRNMYEDFLKKNADQIERLTSE
jgi:hypothetical protein